MTNRRLVKLDDFVKEPTTYNRFGEKVTKTPIERIANGGLLSNYKRLSTNAKYIKFTGMFEPNDGGEGMYIQDDTITNDEDIGVIIYIGEHKYRRLYAAWVNIDWFYLGDFGQALQRACNYNSVRGTTGKTYECKTEVTLKVEQKSSGYATIFDFGHKLIDMRGATVNFTNEEALYCFNIRIYRNDSKFMFTNCNFNVTDNNIGLVNIANIIGVNNYTDMLTGNIYNVSKDKLPDTNRVVLTDAPEIEGIKTFDGVGQVNYVGEALSANDNQAVTKEYKPADYDETAYVSLKDTRKLAGLTTFKDIFDRDQGNIILQGKINNYILDAIQLKLQALLVTNIASVWVPRTYIVYNSNNTAIQNYINIGIPIYKLYAADLAIFLQQQHIIDESEINDFIFTKCVFSKSLKFEPNIVEEEHPVEIVDKTADNRFISDTIAVPTPKIAITTNIPVVIDDVLYTITRAYIVLDGPLITDTRVSELVSYRNKNIIVFTLNNIWYALSVYYTGVWAYQCFNNMGITSGPTTITLTYNNKNYTATVHTKNILNNTITATCIQYYAENIQIITKPVRKFSNFPLDILSINIVGKEYIVNTAVTTYLPDDVVIDEEGYILTNVVYLKFLVPVQANLQQFNSHSATKYTALANIQFIYNDSVITTNNIEIFIARFISVNIPRFELPPIYTNAISTATDHIKYPIFQIYTNNGMLPKTIKITPSLSIIDDSVDIASLNRHISCDKPRCCSDCECNCHTGYGDVTANPNGITRTAYNMHVNTTSKSKTYNYNTYIYACGKGEGGYFRGYWFTTGGPNNLVWIRQGSDIYMQYSTILVNNVYPSLPSQIILPTSSIILQPGETKICYCYYSMPINKVNYRTGATSVHIYIGTSSNACRNDTEINHSISVIQGTPYYTSVMTGLCKQKMFDRLFGTKCLRNAPILRDGVLTDPFRNRTQRPEHQFAPPIGVLNP